VAEPADDGTAEVRSANERFYAAIEAGDLDAMRALWVDDETSLCVHPGAVPVRGPGPIGRSWALLMAGTAYLQFVLTDVEVSLREEVATVTCTENVITAEEGGHLDSFAAGQVVGTNVFVLTPQGWRLWVRHASPVLSTIDDEQ